MLKIGTVVRSTAGHDAGQLFALAGFDSKYVYLCDGKSRPLDRPKRKNDKHVSITDLEINSEDMAANRRLRKALRLLLNEGNESSGRDIDV